MYEEFFGFQGSPFAAVPCADFYVPTTAQEHARQALARVIETAGGPGLLVGPPGTGKTLLCLTLAEQFRDSFSVAMLASARLATRRALLQNILFELGLPYRDRGEGELRLALMDHLEPGPGCPNGLLLLIDEAHTLPVRLLEEVRMITNLVRNGLSRVRLVLAGGPELEERFAHPKLAAFQQRIAARCYLQPLAHDETCQYVRRRIAMVGGRCDDIFTADALTAVHRATEGTARLINQVCDLALLMAAAGGKSTIDAAGIDEAWSDLQQLPAPRKSEHGAAPAGGHVIEFGQLDDEPLAGETAETAATAAADVASAADVATSDSGTDRHVEPLPVLADPLLDENQSQSAVAPLDERSPPQQVPAEAEVLFHGPHELFGGAFDEEEIVIDRYATLGQGGETTRYRVASSEGRDLAAALNETTAVPDATASMGESGARSDRATGGDQRFEDPLDPASDPVMPDYAYRSRDAESAAWQTSSAKPPSDGDWSEGESSRDRRDAEKEGHYYAEPTRPEWLTAAADRAGELIAEAQGAYPAQSAADAQRARPRESGVRDSDDDLIVVEDDTPAGHSVADLPASPERQQPENPPATARRMEYRQLFARLRRG